MTEKLRRNWPALAWAAVMIVAPTVMHVVGLAIPDVVAWPVGIVAPFAGAAFRVLR